VWPDFLPSTYSGSAACCGSDAALEGATPRPRVLETGEAIQYNLQMQSKDFDNWNKKKKSIHASE
jgi:spore coat protein U-like protein